jgi:hypothetical protein
MSDEHDDDALIYDPLLEGEVEGEQEGQDDDHDRRSDDNDYQNDNRQSYSNNKPTKEQFIDILARDEEESDETHANDYNTVMAALIITTEPTVAKLACQAIDKVHISTLFPSLHSFLISLPLSAPSVASAVLVTLNGSSLPHRLSQIFSLEHLIVVLRSLALKLLIASSSSPLLTHLLYQR